MLRDHCGPIRDVNDPDRSASEALGLWYLPWVLLAGELGFTQLSAELKKVKPTAWYGEAALQTTLTREMPEEGEETDAPPGPDVREAVALYCEKIDMWFEETCVPLYNEELQKVVRPQTKKKSKPQRSGGLSFSMPAASLRSQTTGASG